MVALRALAQERVDLVNEHDARLRLAREREQARDELVRLAVPLVREHRRGDVDERRARLLRERLREHRLPAAGRAEEQDAFRRAEEGGGCEEVGEAEGVDYRLLQRGNNRVEPSNV